MGGDKFDIAKGVAKTIINTLTKQDYVNVICARASYWDEVGKYVLLDSQVYGQTGLGGLIRVLTVCHSVCIFWTPIVHSRTTLLKLKDNNSNSWVTKYIKFLGYIWEETMKLSETIFFWAMSLKNIYIYIRWLFTDTYMYMELKDASDKEPELWPRMRIWRIKKHDTKGPFLVIWNLLGLTVPDISVKPAQTLNEPPHDKTNKMTVRPAKIQISLGIRPVWSVFTVHWMHWMGS